MKYSTGFTSLYFLPPASEQLFESNHSMAQTLAGATYALPPQKVTKKTTPWSNLLVGAAMNIFQGL
jgi:hypothetical protein